MDISINNDKWTNPISKDKVNDIQRRAKLWSELREKYPKDEELKNLSMEDMTDIDFWFKKYDEKLKYNKD